MSPHQCRVSPSPIVNSPVCPPPIGSGRIWGSTFDGTNGGTISNATITNNTFGDPSSCTAVMSIDHDEGGNCNGIFFQGDLDGIVIENNTFTHLEEGFHVLCFAGDKCTGSSAPTWNHFIVRWNDFNHIHRIAAEMQPQPATDVVIAFNSYEDAFAPSTFSMGFSLACCAGIRGATVPLVNHNVLLANVKEAGKYIAYAIEWWGNGAQANNNLIQGYWANGIVWGLGGGPWEVRNSVIQGPYMAGPNGCYICDEKEGATTTPIRSGNLTSTTITPIISIAPTISPAGGAISAATTITLADSGIEPFHLLHDRRQHSHHFFDAVYRSLRSKRGNHSKGDRHVGSGRKPKELSARLRLRAQRGRQRKLHHRRGRQAACCQSQPFPRPYLTHAKSFFAFTPIKQVPVPAP